MQHNLMCSFIYIACVQLIMHHTQSAGDNYIGIKIILLLDNVMSSMPKTRNTIQHNVIALPTAVHIQTR